MPRGDGTGPMGLGPFTGWGGVGYRRSRPGIMRRGACGAFALSQVPDKSLLHQEMEWLENRLACLKKELECDHIKD